MKKKISSISFLILFVLLVCCIGFFSFVRLFKFYVNDEVYYNEWTADLGNKFETDICTTFFGKTSFVDMNGAFRSLLGQKEMNGVLKLNNGYLTILMSEVDDAALENYARNLSDFNEYLDSRGTKLVYALAPCTVDKYDPQLPIGKADYSNDNADRLIGFIKDQNIDIIDFREEFHNDGLSCYDMMYKTDHHWTTNAGFYVYCKLEKYITGFSGCTVDERVSDLSQYTVTTYPEWHLGSRGQRTGRYFAGIDDFDLIIPNFETKIQQGDTVGNMQDLTYDLSVLENRDYTSRYTYDAVQNSLGNYVNLESKNDIKILFITDSFGRAVSPYLMMGFHEIAYVYDMSTNILTPDFIETFDPDVVIAMYYLNNALLEDGYNFQNFKQA